jgi:hypothetical protein
MGCERRKMKIQCNYIPVFFEPRGARGVCGFTRPPRNECGFTCNTFGTCEARG